jgi:tRNA nucleotidyltransferase (CCA-adding enzyme)
MVLEQAARLSTDPIVRFAALTHDLGKAVTPTDELPRHIMHEIRGVPIIDRLCERLRVPTAYRQVARLVSRYHLNVHRAQELRESTLLEMLEKLDAFRRPERFEQFLLACEADARGRKGLENREYSQTDYLRRARQITASVTLDESMREGLTGEQIALRLRQLRIQALKAMQDGT